RFAKVVTVVVDEKSASRAKIQTMNEFINHLSNIKTVAETLLEASNDIANAHVGAADVLDLGGAAESFNLPKLTESKLDMDRIATTSGTPAHTSASSSVDSVASMANAGLFKSATHHAVAQLQKEGEEVARLVPAITVSNGNATGST